jgi:hypothetical protein
MRIFTKEAKKSQYHHYYFFWLTNCDQNWHARVKLTCESEKNKNLMEIIILGAFSASAQSLPLRKLTHKDSIMFGFENFRKF